VRALLSRWIARGAEGAAREARYVGVGKMDEGAQWEPVGAFPFESLFFFPLFLSVVPSFSGPGFEARGVRVRTSGYARARPQGMACARCLRAGARDVCADACAYGASLLCRLLLVLLLGVCVAIALSPIQRRTSVHRAFDGRDGSDAVEL
jgi:hypothetical protein